MKAIPSLATLLTSIPLAVSCQHTAPHGSSDSASSNGRAEVTASDEDTIKARRLELVDSKGRTRIVMTGEDKTGGAVLSFRDTEGNPVWFALVAETDGTENPDREPRSVFIMQGGVGGEGPMYSLLLDQDCCEVRVGGPLASYDGSGLAMGFANGKTYVRLGTEGTKVGDALSVQLALSLEGERVFVRDMKGKEIVSCTIPASAISPKKD